MNNELRDQMQNAAIMTLLEKHRLIVEWGTGVGKSRVAVRAVNALFYAGRHKVLLLVAGDEHKANWRKEFIEALGEEIGNDLFDELTVECYASLHKYANTRWDIIVADEAHHLRSELRTSKISSMQADYFLCLSATMSDRNDADELLKELERSFGKFEVTRFGLQPAIDSKILATPTIYVHKLELENIIKPVQVEVEWGWPNARKELLCSYQEFKAIYEGDDSRYANVHIIVNCTAYQGYCILSKFYEKHKEKYMQLKKNTESGTLGKEHRASVERQMNFEKNIMNQYALRRKNLLGECKTEYAKYLLETLSNKKYVCFCSSLEQGSALNEANLLSSKKPNKENNRLIEAYNNDEISSLFAVGKLQEGANLKGIEAGIIVQLYGKERIFTQEFGRTMRSEIPEQHIIVFNKTKDTRYMNNALSNIDKKYINVIDGDKRLVSN